MKFKKGDIVRFEGGKVDWEVDQAIDAVHGWAAEHYVLKSGMSQRYRKAWEHELKPWVPHA